MTTFRAGDIVLIEAEIADDYVHDDATVKVVFDGNRYDAKYVKVAKLTMVRPQFEVGDRVEWGDGLEWCGHVLSIANDHLWVDRGGGDFATVWIGKATRLDADPDFDEIEEAPVAVAATESTYVAMQAAMSAADEPDPIPDLEPRVPRFDGESGEVG